MQLTFDAGPYESPVVMQVTEKTETHVHAESSVANYKFTHEGLRELVLHGMVEVNHDD